jgi:hypothetical protein
MMDYALARAQSKGAISSPSCVWGQAKVPATKASSGSPPPIIDGVDKLYHQLAEIHFIAAA